MERRFYQNQKCIYLRLSWYIQSHKNWRGGDCFEVYPRVYKLIAKIYLHFNTIKDLEIISSFYGKSERDN